MDYQSVPQLYPHLRNVLCLDHNNERLDSTIHSHYLGTRLHI